MFSAHYKVITGDWERKNAGVCHSHYRTSLEERGKAEEDASEDKTLLFSFEFTFVLHLERL